MNKNLANLQKILTAFDAESLTRDEFVQAFEKVVDLVLKIQKEQGEALNKLEETYAILLNKTQTDHTTSLSELKNRVDDLFVGDKVQAISESQKGLFNSLKADISKLIDQKLKDVDLKVEQRVKPGPIGMRGEPGRPPTADEIQMALKPTVEAFRNAWEAKVQSALASRGTGVGGGKQMRGAEKSFTGDGSTTAFTLDHQPGAKGKAIWVFVNGQQQQLGVHYTVGRKTINFTFTPASADTIDTLIIY